jgi:hypothetical protein
VESLLLVFVFFPWTLYYSYVMVHVSDHRFMSSAVMMHSIWLGTWAIMSTRLWSAWHMWMRERREVLLYASGAAARETQTKDVQPALDAKQQPDLLKLVELGQPIGVAQLLATAVAASVAWLGSLSPFLKYFVN